MSDMSKSTSVPVPLVTFITDVKGYEPEILSPVMARETLKIVSLYDQNDVFFECAAPEGGWTHDALCNLDAPLKVVDMVSARGADAYLGKEWVGSTEV